MSVDRHPVRAKLSPLIPEGGMDEGDVGAKEDGQRNAEEGSRQGGEEEIDEDERSRDEEENGERNPKAVRRPNAPTKAQIEEHYPCHAQYRSWCPDCRAGRSLGKQHRRQEEDHDDSLGPVISLDYAFMAGDEVESDRAPVLIAHDHGRGK